VTILFILKAESHFNVVVDPAPAVHAHLNPLVEKTTSEKSSDDRAKISTPAIRAVTVLKILILCVCARAFPIASDERQRLLTFSRPDSPFRAAVIASFQADAVLSVILARFLRLFSCYGGSLSSSTSGADRPLPGAFP